MKKIRTLVLISGSGSNLQALIDACSYADYPAQIVAVISNRPDAFGLNRAKQHGIPTAVLDNRPFATREAFDTELQRVIDGYAPDLVVLAGFMRILTPALVSHYLGRMLNIHPSLLPLYPGLHTHRRALEAGDRPFYWDLEASGDATVLWSQDVAAIFRWPATGYCGLFAHQLFLVYKAFGYDATLANYINGQYGELRVGDGYTDSHSIVEVHVVELDKAIVQDATVNGLIRVGDELLSLREVRQALLDGEAASYDTFDVYFYYAYGSSNDLLLPAWSQASLFDSLSGLELDWRSTGGLSNYIGTQYMFPPITWSEAHTAAPAPGTTFASAVEAADHIAVFADQGESWQSAARLLRSEGYFVSGFQMLDANGQPTSNWLMVRLDDGNYVCVDFDTGQILFGSLDQLVIEAVGKGPVRNPGVDLAFLLDPRIVLKHDFSPQPDWVADDFPIHLDGGPGNDALRGSQWSDIMTGGLGNDIYYVNGAADLVRDQHFGTGRAFRVGQPAMLALDQEAPQRNHEQHAKQTAAHREQRHLQ